MKFDFKNLRWPMARAVATQVAFEYSQHVKGLGRLVHAAVWAIEGAAGLAPYLCCADGACTIAGRVNAFPALR